MYRIFSLPFGVKQYTSRWLMRNKCSFLSLVDPACISIVLLINVFLFIYELFYIVPALIDATGLFYKLHWLLAIFLTHNILGNLVACRRTDIGLSAVKMERQQPPSEQAHLWHLCTHCQMLVPPRAWHCRSCALCVLKRDHHCNFTGCCVGHANHRYFLALVLHMLLGAGLSLIYTMVHVCQQRGVAFFWPIVLAGHIYHRLLDMEKYNGLIFAIGVVKVNLLIVVALAGHLVTQIANIRHGATMHKRCDRSYDLGWWHNLQLVLGRRMFWVLLSPLVDSPLPHDGMQWQLPEQHI